MGKWVLGFNVNMSTQCKAVLLPACRPNSLLNAVTFVLDTEMFKCFSDSHLDMFLSGKYIMNHHLLTE